MRLPFLRRILPVAAVTGLGGLGILGGSQSAEANVEVGVTAGLHTFSVNNELGVPDVANATSARNTAIFGLRLGYTINDMIGIELEGGVLPTEDRGLVYDLWLATARAHVIAQFRAENPDNQLIPFALAGAGLMFVVDSEDETRIGKDEDFYPYIGVGAKYRVENGWGLRFDARALLPPSSANESLALDTEFLVSVYKEWGRKQKTVVEEVVVPVDEDPDKDGISGAADQCPDDPEDADGFQDDDGCPDGDNDGDGIADASDQCPAEAEDADGFQDEDGCPDPDNDGDGVLDAADQCPTESETKNGFQDGDGCPDELPPAVKKYSGTIKGINFKTGSAQILKTSNKVLDGAVKVLTEYPDLRIEIQGHTDDVGDDQKNLELSDARAASVRQYFLSKGIAEDRIMSKGYGETVPSVETTGLKGAKLKNARAQNRRVEFRLVSDLTEGGAAAPSGGTTPPAEGTTPPADEPAPPANP